MRDREALLIQTLQKSGASFGIGDDGVKIGELVYAMDAFNEGSHFKRGWMSLEKLAYKALAVNVSDLYAMNAKPLYALLSLSIPRDFSAKEVTSLSLGIAKACEAFGVKLIGGDTILSSLLGFSFTLIGQASKKTLQRRGMKGGDYLAYTGRVGDSLKGLTTLLRGGRLSSQSRFIRPTLRPKLIAEMTPWLRGGMDISDGIFFECERLSRLNHLGFHFTKPLPKRLGRSGEEYEMLLVIPPQNLSKVRRIAQKHRTPLHLFARAKRGSYRAPCLGHHS